MIKKLAKLFWLLPLALVFSLCISITNAEEVELNTIMMHSTFKIQGIDKDNKPICGTGFIISKQKANQKFGRYTLVTAAHVFHNMVGEKATLMFRQKDGDDYKISPIALQIRKNGQPLWTQHPKSDVAVMYVGFPEKLIQVAASTMLATDEMLEDSAIHPGDTLFCLGYPYCLTLNKSEFPILRGGQIASFPILPTKKVGKIYYDFSVFPGNSGGPVYFAERNRHVKSSLSSLNSVQFIVGLVTEYSARIETITTKSVAESITRTKIHNLGLGIIVPASIISETIDMLDLP